MAGQRGGKRPGAGRKPGSGNKYKIEAAAVEAGISPLDYMLSVLRDKTQDTDMRLAAAKAAAPYVHRALKSIEHTGDEGGPIKAKVILSFE